MNFSGRNHLMEDSADCIDRRDFADDGEFQDSDGLSMRPGTNIPTVRECTGCHEVTVLLLPNPMVRVCWIVRAFADGMPTHGEQQDADWIIAPQLSSLGCLPCGRSDGHVRAERMFAAVLAEAGSE